MRRATTQKPGFFAKSGEDVKNIAETRFLGLSASGFTHSPKKPGFTKFFDCPTIRRGFKPPPHSESRLKTTQEKNLPVLFQRTSAMRQGIDSLPDRGAAGDSLADREMAHNFDRP
jgi:hypothetical protein